MVIVLRESALPSERAEVVHLLIEAGADHVPAPVHCSGGDVICIPDADLASDTWHRIQAAPAVSRVLSVSTPYVLASRPLSPMKTIVQVGEALIGGPDPVVIAGPCSVESETQIFEAARAARDAGAQLLRGGAFKPRTSPYSFQGLGMQGVELLARAGAAAGLPVVTEVMEPGLVPTVAALADVLQVGSRNMQNYPLLRAVGHSGRPVLLKRGFAATLDEWLLAAEYILCEGNPNVILCERGVRSFDQQTRNLLDLTCVPLLGELTHLPVLVDPSHATGRRELVVTMGVAAVAAGADGLLVEMHPHPDTAMSDRDQTIDPAALHLLVSRSRAVRGALTTCDAPTEHDSTRDNAALAQTAGTSGR
jgi:3-deoxy-7-phosphoheptulonate synthase